MEAAKFLKEQMGESKRAANQSASYQKKKWAGKLTMAGWGENSAVHVSKMFQEQEAISLVRLETDLDWQQAMFFEQEQGIGGNIYSAINEYQMQRAGCGQRGCAAHPFAE